MALRGRFGATGSKMVEFWPKTSTVKSVIH
eukprot:COSAG02_NODE_127_length_34879_cov_12.705060_29_plen_30_part_00